MEHHTTLTTNLSLSEIYFSNIPTRNNMQIDSSLTLSTLLIYILKSVTVSVPLTAPINGQIYITSLAGKQTN